jgi:hypothetical protein
MKKVTQAQLKMMGDMGGASYAHQEAWDIQQAASALSFIAGMVMDELDEPQDVQSLANIMRSLMEFIGGEIQDMVTAAKDGAKSADTETINITGGTVTVSPAPVYEGISPHPLINASTTPAQVRTEPLNLDYVKSLGIGTPDFLAVKFTAKDEIKGYSHLWGSPAVTDLEVEYFTKETNFWDQVIGKNARPLTWDHAQDPTFKGSPVIGQIVDFGDDEIGRWYVAKLERSHAYNKAIAELIKAGKLGPSSDSAPQYVERVKTGKATWLKTWPFFAAALTDTPCEPRMIGSLEFLKSLGITLPDMPPEAWEADLANLDFLKIKYFE